MPIAAFSKQRETTLAGKSGAEAAAALTAAEGAGGTATTTTTIEGQSGPKSWEAGETAAPMSGTGVAEGGAAPQQVCRGKIRNLLSAQRQESVCRQMDRYEPTGVGVRTRAGGKGLPGWTDYVYTIRTGWALGGCVGGCSCSGVILLSPVSLSLALLRMFFSV